jgi:response regulator RpfG family c-di-GMP phosphodiesterase
MNDAKISLRCPGCEELVSFLGTDAGTVQDCPECGGWVDVPELFRSPKNEDPLLKESERQFEESARQQNENARLLAQSINSHEEWERQLKQAARYQDQAEETFGRLAALVTRWEILMSRLETKLGG